MIAIQPETMDGSMTFGAPPYAAGLALDLVAKCDGRCALRGTTQIHGVDGQLPRRLPVHTTCNYKAVRDDTSGPSNDHSMCIGSHR